MKAIKIKYSRHAREQMIERGISENEVEEGIRRGAKTLQRDKIIADYRYYRIAYKKIKNTCFVITVIIKW